jgi:hypothetical protein
MGINHRCRINGICTNNNLYDNKEKEIQILKKCSRLTAFFS